MLGRECDKNTKAHLSLTRKPTNPLPAPARPTLHTLYSLTLLSRAPWTQGGHCKGRMGQAVSSESPGPALPTPCPRMHTASTQNITCVLGEVQGSRKIGIPLNKPHRSIPSNPEPRHSSHEETEAQRGTAVRSGSHSVWGQSEAQDLGSQSQGLDSSHDALWPFAANSAGVSRTHPPPPPFPPTRGEAAGRPGPARSTKGILGVL